MEILRIRQCFECIPHKWWDNCSAGFTTKSGTVSEYLSQFNCELSYHDFEGKGEEPVLLFDSDEDKLLFLLRFQ